MDLDGDIRPDIRASPDQPVANAEMAPAEAHPVRRINGCDDVT
jgi:hypothetical protein